MLKRLEIAGFKSFARKTVLDFSSAATAIVGPNGSGKSNVAEAFRFALGEQSMKSMRGKRSEDLIFAGSHSAARANRAAVTIVFDNQERHGKRPFKIDFDEVAIERAVFRDGASEYAINGSRARLRDIQELLSNANIGETGHHIISQGEADRILLSNPKERRAMLEDALGLKVFEFKKAESERKLQKTEENMGQVEAMRRELSPHLKFLGKQVERLERADELRRELVAACQTYFSIEEAYLESEKEKNAAALRAAADRLAVATAEIEKLEDASAGDQQGVVRAEAVRLAERELDRLLGERAALARELGKVEGVLEAAKQHAARASREPFAKIPREDIEALRDEIEKQAAHAGTTPESLAAALAAVRAAMRAFFDKHSSGDDAYLAEEERAALTVEQNRAALIERDAKAAEAIEAARAALSRARAAVLAHEETGREGRHRLLTIANERATQEAEVARQEARSRELALFSQEFEQARAEALALGGTQAVTYEKLAAPPAEERGVQDARKRSMERLKIRLEEAGGTGEDVRKEYEDATQREAFLARELDDLSHSAAGLRSLIKDLDDELSRTFAEGLAQVNASFGEFFAVMFGGGGAKLVLEDLDAGDGEDEDEDAPRQPQAAEKPGIEISVHLPKKKVQSLMQLSGGERALTSIALIFAMSQVNPPPFLILDETDAALDEANSRRYGDMVETLAKKSQLIVITHNRETMSRAGILYGVTMGGDGVSKLLSVKFDEAVAVAK
ncbi:MAG TPA: AAA family ATPase [Candidatus Paceibacterota bacterium]